jgi:hypothetical protein
MVRTSALVACLSAIVFALPGARLATAAPEAPPPIDWRDFVDGMGDDGGQGDHLVGEELCAAPGAAESVPDSFVFI